MKNFKLLLRSLLSNNTCIDGARTKRWFWAVLMFLFSLVVALVPSFVSSMKANGFDTVANTTYLTREAMMDFSSNVLDNDAVQMYVQYNEQVDQNSLYMSGFEGIHECKDGETTYYKVCYYKEITEEISNAITENKNYKGSYIVFTDTQIIVNIVVGENSNSFVCLDAYKHFDKDFDFKGMLVKDKTATENINGTWNNWYNFFRTSYKTTKYNVVWRQCALISGINAFIMLLLGFLVWILTRGKNNPYRLFTFWEGQKISYWASISPAILACAFGFLFKNFATALFPLLLGIRVMWLTMKSLRADGTGYAAN